MLKRTSDGHTRSHEQRDLWARARTSGRRIGAYVRENPSNTAMIAAATVGALVGVYVFLGWQRRRMSESA
jgi:hypothetical protein